MLGTVLAVSLIVTHGSFANMLAASPSLVLDASVFVIFRIDHRRWLGHYWRSV